jgi:hypothetical protein
VAEVEKAKLIQAMRYVMTRVKHGPGGLGGPGKCDVDCLKCALSNKIVDIEVGG